MDAAPALETPSASAGTANVPTSGTASASAWEAEVPTSEKS